MESISVQAVQDAVGIFADFLLKYLVALAAVGALSMAFIEGWKAIFDSRTRYHMRAIQRWIGVEGGRDFATARALRKADPPSPALAYAELIHLTTGTDLPRDEAEAKRLFAYSERVSKRAMIPRDAELALFSLELGRMMGHIQDAGDAAIKNPDLYPNFYRFLTWGAGKEVEEWAKLSDKPLSSKKPDRDKAQARANLYARLHAAAKRKLDGFQLYTAYRWTNLNQLAANVVGAATLFAVLVAVHCWGGKDFKGWTLPFFILISLAGGVLAPVAKDIVVALQKVRGRG